MAVITFWSPFEKTSTWDTANISAVSAITGIEYYLKSLLTHTNYNSTILEQAFFDIKSEKKNEDSFSFANTGIVALNKLLESDKLNPDNIKTYTRPIFKDRLDLLYGVSKVDPSEFDKIIESIFEITDIAKSVYDLIFIDVKKGLNNQITNKLLAKSDLIVVNLRQDLAHTERFAKELDTFEILKKKPYVILIGRYDRYSRNTVKNIKRNFNFKAPMFAIPYNSVFFDACGTGEVDDFIAQNKSAHRLDRNGEFIFEVKKFIDFMLKSVGINIEDKKMM